MSVYPRLFHPHPLHNPFLPPSNTALTSNSHDQPRHRLHNLPHRPLRRSRHSTHARSPTRRRPNLRLHRASPPQILSLTTSRPATPQQQQQQTTTLQRPRTATTAQRLPRPTTTIILQRRGKIPFSTPANATRRLATTSKPLRLPPSTLRLSTTTAI